MASPADSPPPRRLDRPTEDDINRMLGILGEAFSNDKALAVATGGSPTIRSAYLHTIVDNANRNGQIYVVGPEPEFDGVALWAPPGVDWAPCDDQDYRKLLPADVLEWIVHHAIPMYEELYKTAFGPRGTEVSILAWHVKLIAVRPSRQRQGLGKSLMRVICKEASQGMYRMVADCHTQISVGFFQKLGFRHQAVKNYYSPLGVGFPLWCMLREPPS